MTAYPGTKSRPTPNPSCQTLDRMEPPLFMSASSSSQLFRPFEIEALRFMLGPELTAAWLEEIVTSAKLVSYNYSGSGYFLTVTHSVLPQERSVFSDRPVVGNAGDIQVGFVAFVQDRELMLECHTWGAIDVPSVFRDLEVKVSILGDHEVVRVGGNSAAYPLHRAMSPPWSQTQWCPIWQPLPRFESTCRERQLHGYSTCRLAACTLLGQCRSTSTQACSVRRLQCLPESGRAPV
jgi:hypothetical protein